MTAHAHSWDAEVICHEISDAVCLSPIQVGEHPSGIRGYWLGHDLPGGGERCMGLVATSRTDGGPVWSETGTLEGGDLTLSPSVNCLQPTGAGRDRHGPDYHGFVRAGKWVPA